MPRARIRTNKVREIIRLHETAGLSVRQTVKALGVSRPIVDQYLKPARYAGLGWTEVEAMEDGELLQRFEELTVRPETVT